jgi:chromosome condensin MukBEF ATPase and DNA-binding subunit MukB
VIYLTMIRWVGFFVSTFLFVIVISRLFGGKGWAKPIALSMGVNVFCYFLFEVWLKLSFPAGFLF